MPPGRVTAVIDVGSNSIRLLVAREASPLAFEVLDEERFDARLGQSQVDGRLGLASVERGLHALRALCQVARSHNPDEIVAAGTEALRRAPNASDFLAEVEAETGIAIRILSAEEEAFASFLGTINATDFDSGHLIDIGGGSLEVMEVAERSLAAIQSAPLGALYATERFFDHDPPTTKEVRALRKSVRQQIHIDSATPALYGVGGAIRNLARIVRLRRRYPLRRLHGLVIQRRDLRRLMRDLLAVDAAARRRIPAVNAARADILPAAAVVVDELMEMADSDALHVSGQGLREGLLWQRIRSDTPILPDVRSASISHLAAANGVDISVAEQVDAAATTLFDATEPLHGLGPPMRQLLAAAARLADIGLHIDYYDRDRHAEYLIHSSALHGFSHREIVLLGALVRCADGGTPDLGPYSNVVDPEDADHAARLAALLGLARAVCRRRPSPVRRFRAVVDEGQLLLSLRGEDSLEAEAAALEVQRKRFEAHFPLTLAIRAVR